MGVRGGRGVERVGNRDNRTDLQVLNDKIVEQQPIIEAADSGEVRGPLAHMRRSTAARSVQNLSEMVRQVLDRNFRMDRMRLTGEFDR